jgi:pimeloyl-ACP methyl ester carboxylesterase
MWHYQEQGSGRPLILLHGIGMSHTAWKPVLPLLARERRVIAFDVAGFGKTPPLPAGTPPTIPNLVAGLAASLRELGINEPGDFAGNSMGGYMALEAAKAGLARSVVGISPAGLWRGHSSPLVKYVFNSMRYATRAFPSLVKTTLQVPPLRELFLAVPVSVGGWHMPAEDAFGAALDFAHAQGFDDTFASVAPFSGGQNITVPVTIAFGTRDWLLTAGARHRDQLPGHVHWLEPQGWGHVPMWKDPQGVAELISQGTV